MWIQIVLIAAVVIIGIALIRRPGGDVHLAIRRLTLMAFVIGAVLSILFPQWLTWLADLLGVGRGTDLVLYALVVVFLVFVSTQYRRNVELNRKISLLSRRIALNEAKSAEEATAASKADQD